MIHAAIYVPIALFCRCRRRIGKNDYLRNYQTSKRDHNSSFQLFVVNFGSEDLRSSSRCPLSPAHAFVNLVQRISPINSRFPLFLTSSEISSSNSSNTLSQYILSWSSKYSNIRLGYQTREKSTTLFFFTQGS